jgi:hypothetical protein
MYLELTFNIDIDNLWSSSSPPPNIGLFYKKEIEDQHDLIRLANHYSLYENPKILPLLVCGRWCEIWPCS